MSEDDAYLAAHWAAYGRRGVPVEDPVPDAGRVGPDRDFVAGERVAAQPLRFDAEQLSRLLLGYPGTDPDDRWVVAAVPRADGVTVVTFHRADTGALAVRLDLVRGRSGAIAASIAWETSADVLAEPLTLASAIMTVIEVCRWVLRMDPPPRFG